MSMVYLILFRRVWNTISASVTTEHINFTQLSLGSTQRSFLCMYSFEEMVYLKFYKQYLGSHNQPSSFCERNIITQNYNS